MNLRGVLLRLVCEYNSLLGDRLGHAGRADDRCRPVSGDLCSHERKLITKLGIRGFLI